MTITYLTTAEVAAILRVSDDYVSRQCALGNLRAKKLGNGWRINEDDVKRFMSGEGKAPATRYRTARQKKRSA